MTTTNAQPTATQTRNLLADTSAEVFNVGHGHSIMIQAEKSDHAVITATMKESFPYGRYSLETPFAWLGDNMTTSTTNCKKPIARDQFALGLYREGYKLSGPMADSALRAWRAARALDAQMTVAEIQADVARRQAMNMTTTNKAQRAQLAADKVKSDRAAEAIDYRTQLEALRKSHRTTSDFPAGKLGCFAPADQKPWILCA